MYDCLCEIYCCISDKGRVEGSVKVIYVTWHSICSTINTPTAMYGIGLKPWPH